MTIDPATSVRDLAVGVPGATHVFERFHIDYCCHGETRLSEACAKAGVSIDAVQEEMSRSTGAQTAGWNGGSLGALMRHITQRHHAFTRDALDRLASLGAQVVAAHGAKHLWLAEVRDRVEELDRDLRPHMLKEERVLFPYIEGLEAAKRSGRRWGVPAFGSVRNPVHMMMLEHDHCGEVLRAIRTATSNYELPADACASFASFYATLQELEADLHEHIHLETNILFPRAMALEES